MISSYLLCAAVAGLGIFPRPEMVCEHAETIIQSSKENNLDPSLVTALIAVESNWNHKVVSYGGACGLMQIIPKYTKKYNKEGRNFTCDELRDPVVSITTGTKILNYWLYKYGKRNLSIGLCGYNAGFRCKGENANVAGKNYAKKVLKYKRILDRSIRKKKHEENKNRQSCNWIFFRIGNICF
jgi:soluble lytic murein transglycosylase-like protein